MHTIIAKSISEYIRTSLSEISFIYLNILVNPHLKLVSLYYSNILRQIEAHILSSISDLPRGCLSRPWSTPTRSRGPPAASRDPAPKHPRRGAPGTRNRAFWVHKSSREFRLVALARRLSRCSSIHRRLGFWSRGRRSALAPWLRIRIWRAASRRSRPTTRWTTPTSTRSTPPAATSGYVLCAVPSRLLLMSTCCLVSSACRVGSSPVSAGGFQFLNFESWLFASCTGIRLKKNRSFCLISAVFVRALQYKEVVGSGAFKTVYLPSLSSAVYGLIQ